MADPDDQLLQQVSKAAAQEERNRLARDLHDSIKQQLFSIIINVAAVKARWEHNPASVRKIVDDIERIALEAQVEMQALLQQLRPSALENMGLSESLRMQCQALGYRTGAEVSAELCDLPASDLLPSGLQETIFRIVQEGFANIARHARASHVWLSLRQQQDALLVEIGDDGQGFDLIQAQEHSDSYFQHPQADSEDTVLPPLLEGEPSPQIRKDQVQIQYGGMGLANIRERVEALGGTVTVWSLPDKGTTLHLCIPLVKVPPETQALERKKEKLAPIVARTHSLLRAGRLAAELAAALILLYTPAFIAMWAVLTCIIGAFGAWLWTQRHRWYIYRELGREQRVNLALLAESYGLLSAILLLCMLWPNYLTHFSDALYPILRPGGVTGNITPIGWMAGSFFGIFTIAIVVTYARYAQNISRYYKTLSYNEAQKETRQQLRELIIDWVAWSIVTGLTILALNFFPAILAGPAAQSMDEILLTAWSGVIILKSVRTVREHSTLRRLAKQAAPDGKGGGS